MNILFTVSYYKPYISGITVYAQRLAASLSKRGYNVTIVTTQLDKNLSKKEIEKGVRVIRVPIALKLYKGFIMPSYIFKIWQQVSKSEAVVSHLPQFESLFVAFIAKILRKKYYVIYHCEVKLPSSIFGRIIELLLYHFHFITLVLADKIITTTKDYAINSSLLPKFLAKTFYIYPPIPHLPLNDISVSDNLMKQKIYAIGVVARLSTEKGFEYLFSAIPFIKKSLGENFEIHIVGPMYPMGESAYMKKLSSLLEKFKNYIHFTDTIKDNEMVKFYKSLDVLVLPSINKTEAFGMVQVEAMLCGVPVVASNLPGVRVPIRVTGMGEIAVPADSESLAQKIVKVLHNKEKYCKNTSRVKKIFSYEKTIQQYEKILNSVS